LPPFSAVPAGFNYQEEQDYNQDPERDTVEVVDNNLAQDHGDGDTQSDELNLRSLDEAVDWVENENYPRQVLYEDDGSEDADYHPSDASMPTARISDAAYQFYVPEEVEQQARDAHKQVEKYQTILRRMDGKFAPRRAIKPIHVKQDFGTSNIEAPTPSPTPDQAMASYERPESIDDWSDDYQDDPSVEGVRVDKYEADHENRREEDTRPSKRTRFSTVVEQGEDESMGSGFFDGDGQLGFRLWRDPPLQAR
jgi:hypothetical protein